jgi:GNAT superfamily N-acetyltransferase
MDLVIKSIKYDDILPSWRKLWRSRQDLESHSAMLMMGGHDPEIKNTFKWSAYAVYDWDKCVAVNAGHKSSKRDYRTRGLWVDETHRGRGIAKMMFEKLEHQAKSECCRWLWSYPRLAALPAYINSGYVPFGKPEHGEFDQCTRARKDLSYLTTTVWSVDNNPCESQQWVEAVDELDKKGFLLGQNEEVRGNHIHITQHWVNDLYATPMVGVKNFMDPVERVYGELNNPIHVL